MGNFEKICLFGNAPTAMFSKDKGDFSNRVRCAGTHVKNNAQMVAADAVVIGGTVATAKALTKSQKLVKILSAPLKGLINGLKKGRVDKKLKNAAKLRPTVAKYVEILKKIKANPKLQAAIVLGTTTVGLLTYIRDKAIYKMGKTDQKYEDKAKIEKAQKSVID